MRIHKRTQTHTRTWEITPGEPYRHNGTWVPSNVPAVHTVNGRLPIHTGLPRVRVPSSVALVRSTVFELDKTVPVTVKRVRDTVRETDTAVIPGSASSA
jgi:hypothetical protein